MSATLSIQNISRSFGGVQAVRECNVEIKKGSITGLIGPNGAGKTTLFNLVAGVYAPDHGSVFLEHEDITALAPHRLFRKGVVRTFQIPHEFGNLTVLENLMLVPGNQYGENLVNALFRPGKVKREEKQHLERAREITCFLKIDHLENEPANNLSGGQKKLLELGRTLMTDARVLLLDEPAAGVNRSLLKVLMNAIKQLNREQGYTVCIVEHDMDLVRKLCHPVVVMHDGEVLTEGSMDDVTSNRAVQKAYLGQDDLEAA